MFQEFKQFAMQGNVVDLAVGIVIGAAFGVIVNSVVQDVMMPVVGLFTGGLDFSQRFILLHDGVPVGPVRDGRRRQGRRRGNTELRPLHQRRGELHDRRVRAVHGRQGNECRTPHKEGRTRGSGAAAGAHC